MQSFFDGRPHLFHFAIHRSKLDVERELVVVVAAVEQPVAVSENTADSAGLDVCASVGEQTAAAAAE